jgi:hypothetical protein
MQQRIVNTQGSAIICAEATDTIAQPNTWVASEEAGSVIKTVGEGGKEGGSNMRLSFI